MTHINAYFADVDEAKAKLEQAKGDLAAAEARLETKKLEDGYKEPEAEEAEQAEPEEPKAEKKEPEPKEEPKPHTVPVRRK